MSSLHESYRESRYTLGMGNISFTEWTLPEHTVDVYTDSLMEEAHAFSDMDMIGISRFGGEGQDVPSDMNAVINGTYDIRDEVADDNPNYGYFGFVPEHRHGCGSAFRRCNGCTAAAPQKEKESTKRNMTQKPRRRNFRRWGLVVLKITEKD